MKQKVARPRAPRHAIGLDIQPGWSVRVETIGSRIISPSWGTDPSLLSFRDPGSLLKEVLDISLPTP